MIFRPNQDLRHFRAPWYEKTPPFLAAVVIVLILTAVQSLDWFLQ